MPHSNSSHPITLLGVAVVTAVLASMLPSSHPSASTTPLPQESHAFQAQTLFASSLELEQSSADPHWIQDGVPEVDPCLSEGHGHEGEAELVLVEELVAPEEGLLGSSPPSVDLSAEIAALAKPEFQEIQDKLKGGQTVARALKKHGLSRRQVDEIVKATRGLYDFRRAPAGMDYELRIRSEDNRVESFLFSPGPAKAFMLSRGEEGRLQGQGLNHEERVVEVEVAARIESSLYQAIRDAGESPKLASRIADVFSWDMDFSRDVKRGDTFRMIIEKRYLGEQVLGYGRVLAAEYSGARKNFQAFWFVPPGETKGAYYQANGDSAEKSFLATPVEYTRISSRFRKNRRHPILGFTKAHNGTDYAAPTGTPVRALASGKVTFAGRRGASGKLVIIKHDQGLESYYAHLSKISKGLKPGTRVNQKTMIGRVGTTGRSTGPHLHLGIKKHGRWIDPQKLKVSRMEPLSPEHRIAFQALVASQGSRIAQISLPGEAAADRKVMTASLR